MGLDFFFFVKGLDTPPGQEPMGYALSRASSMGPCLAAYAKRHCPGPQGPERFCLTRGDWEAFTEALREQLPLIEALTDCVESVFDFDPDVPDGIRPPGAEDWKRLAAFDRWFCDLFRAPARSWAEPFSLERRHFETGVERAYALALWLRLDADVRQALEEPENRVYLLIG